MFLVIVGLVAAAAASPQYFQQVIHEGPGQYYTYPNVYTGFDQNYFWGQFNKNMQNLGNAMADLHRAFPPTTTNVKIINNQYIVTIELDGFEKKDIELKVTENLLKVKAVRNGVTCHLNILTLPENVNTTDGSWTFAKGTLKIVFPLKGDDQQEDSWWKAEVVPNDDQTHTVSEQRRDIINVKN